jgi:hypothetical protein
VAEQACQQFNEALAVWIEATNEQRYDQQFVNEILAKVAGLYDDMQGIALLRREMIIAIGRPGQH